MKTTPFLLAALGCAALAVSCSKNEKTVPVKILLTDAPTAYDAVNIHIREIRVNLRNDTAGWITLPTNDTTLNLLDLQNGVTTTIAQGNVPDGVLHEVRFVLGDDNNVVVNGVTHPLQTPSAQSSGLKIKLHKDLNETMNTFTLDFDAAESVKEQNGSYKLMPVIRLKP
jgi:hypothetical protein